MKPGLGALLPVLLIAALAGCEIRNDAASEAEPEPAATLAADPDQPPGQTETPASIIRPDVSADILPPIVKVPEPLAATVGFPEGGFQLDEDALGVLAAVLDSPQLSEGWPIVLRGHTDSVGNDSGNLIASRRRAESVAGWLVDQGVAQERIEIIAMGEQRPVAPNARLDGAADETGRARNRRVEIWIGPAGTQPSAGPFAPDRGAQTTRTDQDA